MDELMAEEAKCKEAEDELSKEMKAFAHE